MSRRTDPFQEVEELLDQLTQFGPETGADVSVDIIDDDDAFRVVADLPGYEPGDIEVELHDERRLHISAERETEREREEGDVVRRERRQQSASRTVTLPGPVDEGDTEAGYENGVLTVRLGKQTGGDGTDIPVN